MMKNKKLVAIGILRKKSDNRASYIDFIREDGRVYRKPVKRKNETTRLN